MANPPKAPQDVEVLAQNVTKEGNVIHAVGNVVLYSPKYLITADEAFYNHETGDLDLHGNVTMQEGVSYASRSGHTKININTDQGNASPLFFFDETSNIWLQCDTAILDAELYITQKSIVSSCNTQNPDWKIEFSTGELNKESKWMHLYNPVFYAGDMPLLYLPYFSFSTDTTRRTGLLKPEVGAGGEGLFYLQPIYFAPDANWDLEISPQIRTERGKGVHSTYRFVDSPYSKGEVKVGYFREFDNYAADKNLKNNEHYGYSVMYDRSALLSPRYDNLEDGLWLELNYLNDIDYYNTLSNETRTYDKLVISRMNYYAKRDLDYVGFYSKYYIDTSKISNNDTLQELPTVQYHRFSNPLMMDNLLYSLDYKTKNFERSEGVNALQHEFSAPLTLYFTFLEDYLHVSISENVYMTYVSYDGSSTTLGNSGRRLNNFHKLSTFTELARAYDDFFHTINASLDYRIPSYKDVEGTWNYTYGTNDLIPIQQIKESMVFSLKEFFYDQDADKKISHVLRQIYYNEDQYKYGDLENDLKYHISENLSLGHALSYSHEFSKVSRNQFSINYTDDIYTASLRYTNQDEVYKENSLYIEDIDTSNALNERYDYITLYTNTKYIPLYDIFASIDYDVNEENFKSWNVGFKKSTKCWDYSLQYRDIKIPKLTSSSIDSINRKGIMLQFNFYPIGNINHDFATEKEQKL